MWFGWNGPGLVASPLPPEEDPMEKQAAQLLQVEIQQDQDWSPLVNHWLREGRRAQDVLLDLWIEQLAAKRRAWMKRLHVDSLC
jgi:hypothetical protein